MQEKITIYRLDKRQLDAIAGRMREFCNICREADVPMFATAAVASYEFGTEYFTISASSKKQKGMFNLSPENAEEIENGLISLLSIAQILDVPMFAMAATGTKSKEVLYSNIVYGAKSHDITLFDDRIQKHILVANGFQPQPPRNIFELELPAESLHEKKNTSVEVNKEK